MEYARIPILSSPAGCFIYVLHFEGANYLQIGIGYESGNGLQVTHVDGVKVHQLCCNEVADGIEQSGTFPVLPTGRLTAYLDSALGLDAVWAIRARPAEVDMPSTEECRRTLAQAIRKAHLAVWGHEHDWDVQIKSLNDGRLLWFAYDAGMDKIKVGIGYHGPDNDAALGDTVYAIGQEFVAAFATGLFGSKKPVYFFGRPPRWPLEFSPWVEGKHVQTLAVELIRLADKVWDDLPVHRTLTDIERESLTTP